MLSKHDFHVSLGRTARFGGHFSQHPFTTGCGNISYSICLQLAGSLKVKHLTSVPAGGVCPLDWTGIDKQACLACCLVPNLTWTRTLKQNLKADVLKKKKNRHKRLHILPDYTKFQHRQNHPWWRSPGGGRRQWRRAWGWLLGYAVLCLDFGGYIGVVIVWKFSDCLLMISMLFWMNSISNLKHLLTKRSFDLYLNPYDPVFCSNCTCLQPLSLPQRP